MEMFIGFTTILMMGIQLYLTLALHGVAPAGTTILAELLKKFGKIMDPQDSQE
jgi:hypothetical protein